MSTGGNLQREDTESAKQFWAEVESVAAKAPKEVVERIVQELEKNKPK
jgi:hypothetical protein